MNKEIVMTKVDEWIKSNEKLMIFPITTDHTKEYVGFWDELEEIQMDIRSELVPSSCVISLKVKDDGYILIVGVKM